MAASSTSLLQLPAELLLDILSLLDARSLAACRLACSTLRCLADHDQLWSAKCRELGIAEPFHEDWRRTHRFLHAMPDLPPDRLQLLFFLGPGPTKRVFAARLQLTPLSPPRLVCVHVYASGTPESDITKELAIWRQLKHPSVCRLLATVGVSSSAAASSSAPADQHRKSKKSLFRPTKKHPPVASPSAKAACQYDPDCFVEDPDRKSLVAALLMDDHQLFNAELVDYLERAKERSFLRVAKQPAYSHAAVCELFGADLQRFAIRGPSTADAALPALRLVDKLSMLSDLVSALVYLHQRSPPVVMVALTATKCYTYQRGRAPASHPDPASDWHVKLGGFFEARESDQPYLKAMDVDSFLHIARSMLRPHHADLQHSPVHHLLVDILPPTQPAEQPSLVVIRSKLWRALQLIHV